MAASGLLVRKEFRVQNRLPTLHEHPNAARHARDDLRALVLSSDFDELNQQSLADSRARPWQFDLFERRLIAPGGSATRLSALEYALLRASLRHPRQLLR